MYVLIGTISSGKSTYATKKAEEGAIIVNDDAIVQIVHGGDYTLYSKKLKPLYKTIEISIATCALSMNLDVVIDRGINITMDSRKRWIGLAKAFDTDVRAVVFPFENAKIHAHRRFMANNRGLSYQHWLDAATRHIKEYDEPDLFVEGWTDIEFIGKEESIL
jgi:predicted kinase